MLHSGTTAQYYQKYEKLPFSQTKFKMFTELYALLSSHFVSS